MSSNDLVGGKKTCKEMSPNWRYAVPNFLLEMNDQTWPELPSVGKKMLNKDTCVPKTHVSKFCCVGNRDKLSESHKSFPIDSAEQSNKSGTCFCECEVTSKHINHMEPVINRTSVEHASSKGRNTFAVDFVSSNFSATQEKNDPVVSERRVGKIGQKIIDSDLMENCNQGVHKKTDTKLAALYERNFQNDFLLEFPTLDVNKKKVNSKSGQLHKHYNDNCKHSLGGNTKKPKAKDPICINLLDIISTIPIKPKLVRGKFETRLQSTSLVSIVKPLPKRVYASAHICGNALDSDKPFRRRGKVRVNKKFKPSQLKAIILKTREETLKTRQAAKMRLINSKTLLLNEFAPSLYTNIVDCNGKSLKEVCTNGNENDNSGQYTVIHNNGKIATSPLLHTRKFREYCNNCLTTALVQSVSLLVETVVHYQDRQYARDPIKAHAKRRYVVGLREARKYLKMKRIRMLIIAPDLEHIPGEGGIDYTIQQLKSDAEVQHVPYLFGPNRKQLGKFSRKNVLVSCIAILNYEGAEDLVSKVLQHLLEARKKYSALASVCVYGSMASLKNKNTKEKEESVDTEAIVSLLQKLTCSDSNISQKETVDLEKHPVSSPFLAAIENIL